MTNSMALTMEERGLITYLQNQINQTDALCLAKTQSISDIENQIDEATSENSIRQLKQLLYERQSELYILRFRLDFLQNQLIEFRSSL